MAGIRHAGVVVALLIAAGFAARAAGTPAAPSDGSRRDHWYVLELGDQPVGWMHRRRVHGSAGEDGLDVVRTEHRTRLNIVRAGTALVIESASSFVESADGAPRSASVRTGTGETRTALDWRFADKSIIERREEDGRVVTRERPLPERPWLTPAAADLLVAGRIEAGAGRIGWATLDPEAGLAAVRITMEADGRERLEIRGRPVAASRWRVRSSATPALETMQWRSRDGHLLAETTETALGRLRARLSSREHALAAGAAEPAEVMMPAMIEPAGRVDRDWRRVRYAIRRGGGGGDPPMPGGGPQRVVPADGGALGAPGEAGEAGAADKAEAGWWRVTVDPDFREPGETPPVPADLAATAMIDAGDEAVRRLAARAIAAADARAREKARDTAGANVDAEADDHARAEAMRRLVRAHIDRKELDRLFDSASRAARAGHGDCSEHAVLLAAMLRSAGIPARVAIGLVDADGLAGRRNVFAWHMWTRAWVDGRWVDLDATRRRPFGPTHLRVAESAGEDGALLGHLTELLASVGRLEIRVLGGDR